LAESNQPQTASTGSESVLADVEAVVRPVVAACGLELFDLALRAERSGWVLRVVIDAPASRDATGGVTVDECADISRDVSTALDATDPIKHAYALEVSSPGVERPLRGPEDYVRFEGKSAKVKLTKAREGIGTVARGVLAGVQDDNLMLARGEGDLVALPFESIRQAQLVFEIVAQPKKTPSKKSRPKGRRD
jgi:ribosome maturation factor RimP